MNVTEIFPTPQCQQALVGVGVGVGSGGHRAELGWVWGVMGIVWSPATK